MQKIAVCLTVILLLMQNAYAAAPMPSFSPDRATELHDQRLREMEDNQRRRMLLTPPAEQPEPTKPQPHKETGHCIPINTISVEGDTLLSSHQVRAITQAHEGQCLTLGGINTVLQELTNAYVQKGYVGSRAVLEPQDLSLGVLHIRVIEGRVESIEMSPGSTMNARQLKTIFPFVKGSVLQLRDIEQGLDQLNRLPSNRAIMSIAPGSQVGESKVVIDNVQERTWRPSVGFDNLGQDTTGRAEYTLGLEKDNFIGCNDQFSFYYTGSMPQVFGQFKNDWEGASESVTGLFSIPLGYWLLSGSASRFNYTTQIYGLNQAYTSSGTTSAMRLALDRVIWRDGNGKLSLGTFIRHCMTKDSTAWAASAARTALAKRLGR